MTPEAAERLLRVILHRPLDLEDLYERMCREGGHWSRDQLALFLGCVAGVTCDAGGLFRFNDPDPGDTLADAVLAVVRSRPGGHVTPAELCRLLPSHFITTDKLLLAVARQSPHLEVFGPNLIRIVL